MNWVEETLVAVWGGGVDSGSLDAAKVGAFEASAPTPALASSPSRCAIFDACLGALVRGAEALDDELWRWPAGSATGAAPGDRKSLLHAAARGDDGDAVGVLAGGHGADVDAVARDGGTPLHHACYHGAWRAAATLVARGASVRAANLRGETPAAAARSGGHEWLARAVDSGLESRVGGSPDGPRFRDYASRCYAGYGRGRKRVIQRRFNVGVLEAIPKRKASTL